jgi:hypothetical protein
LANKEKSLNLQSRVDATTHHVLEKLVGVRGRSVGDVAYFVIRQWISEHGEELAAMGIRIQVPGGTLEVTDEVRRQQ